MRVRGHHLVCTYCFHGSGKTEARDFFGVDNAIPELVRALRLNPDLEIAVCADRDDVCRECPLLRPDGCGRSADAAAQNEKLRGWDRTILQTLGLRDGQRLRARDLEARLRERLPDIGRICTNCTSAAPSGWAEYRRALRDGLWEDPPA
ncbi:MAG: DUF1284 domain-containing protein [Lentisphaerae bacterium]|nr:DUF1284 domain-containing protein [Lentisphaerota bacterium]